MAAEDTHLVYTDNPGNIPASYTVPPDLSLDVSSVFARIDGSAAAGSFVPCLSILSQDGHLLARVPADQTMASGDTATVTWAPFLRAGGSVGPPGPPASVKSIQFYTTTGFVVPGGNDQSVSFDNVSGFDATVFGVLTSGGRTNRVILKQQGAYGCFAWLDWGSHVGLKTTFMYNIVPIGPLIWGAQQSQVYDLGGLNATPGQLSYVRVLPPDFSGDTVPQTFFFYVGHDAPGNLTTSIILWQFVYFGPTDF